MRLFLDSSVMIAGAASAEGASRSVFRLAGTHEWRLVTTPYAVEETVRNLAAFAPSVTASWLRLRSQLVVVDDVVTIDKPAVFPVEKDRPILFSALASADVLLTLDRADFSRLLGDLFYGLAVMTPGMWLSREREAGRLGRVWRGIARASQRTSCDAMRAGAASCEENSPSRNSPICSFSRIER